MGKYDDIQLSRKYDYLQLLNNPELAKLQLARSGRFDHIVMEHVAAMRRKGPVAPPAQNSADALQPLRDIGGLVYLADSILGMGGAAGNLTAINDMSGNLCPFTITGLPQFSSTKWNGTQPGMQLVGGSGARLRVVVPAKNQPVTDFMVIDGYTHSAAANGFNNLINDGAMVTYAQGVFDPRPWRLTAGSLFAAVGLTTASVGKYVRISVFNGVSSKMYRSATFETGDAGVGGGGTDCYIGARSDGIDPANVITPAFGRYSKALSVAEIAVLIAFYMNRYTGINAA